MSSANEPKGHAMTQRDIKRRLFEVRVREIHEVIYEVEAADEDEARERYGESPSIPHTADAHEDSIVSVREIQP